MSCIGDPSNKHVHVASRKLFLLSYMSFRFSFFFFSIFLFWFRALDSDGFPSAIQRVKYFLSYRRVQSETFPIVTRALA